MAPGLRSMLAALKRNETLGRFKPHPFRDPHEEFAEDFENLKSDFQSCPLCGASSFPANDFFKHYKACKKSLSGLCSVNRYEDQKRELNDMQAQDPACSTSQCDTLRSSRQEEAGDSQQQGDSQDNETHTSSRTWHPCCNICDRYFSSGSSLHQHRVNEHLTTPSDLCPVCYVECNLADHLNRVARHRCPRDPAPISEEEPKACPRCEFEFLTAEDHKLHRREINRHNRIMHNIEAEAAGREWQYYCYPCDIYLGSEPELLKHRDICTSPLRYLTRFEGELLQATVNEKSTISEPSGLLLIFPEPVCNTEGHGEDDPSSCQAPEKSYTSPNQCQASSSFSPFEDESPAAPGPSRLPISPFLEEDGRLDFDWHLEHMRSAAQALDPISPFVTEAEVEADQAAIPSSEANIRSSTYRRTSRTQFGREIQIPQQINENTRFETSDTLSEEEEELPPYSGSFLRQGTQSRRNTRSGQEPSIHEHILRTLPRVPEGPNIDALSILPEPSRSPNRRSKLALYECPLCFNECDNLSSVSCGHVFCTTCITRSLGRDPNCPTCRTPADIQHIRRVFLN